jgi:DNA replication and repair protein RecF
LWAKLIIHFALKKESNHHVEVLQVMSITKINISNFRIIESSSFELHPDVNIFIGENGSGKTSVLEAIYFLFTGRSFRTSSARNFIRRDTSKSTLFVLLEDDKSGIKHKIGVDKSSNRVDLLVDGSYATSFSSVARLAPMQIVEPASFNMLAGAPDSRRRYLDWLVFHVEHDFIQHWKRYKNILKQRNSLCRRAKIDPRELSVWDAQLALHGEYINEHRLKHLLLLKGYIAKHLSSFGFACESDLSIQYVTGWDESKSLEAELLLARAGDIERGHTRYGPHRADVRISIGGVAADEVLSRGQQKIFCICMKLAQCEYLRVCFDRKTIFLLDDIGSELDSGNLQKVYQSLSDLKAQVLVTSIEPFDVEKNYTKGSNAVFHVEHGKISQQN